MQAAQCVYEEREERESERGSSQCNGIEESEEEEEESEWELLDLPRLRACPSSAEAWVYRRATLHWHRAESRPICSAVHTLSTDAEPHSAGSYSSEEKARGRVYRAFSITKGGTQQLRKGPDATI